MKKAFSVFLCLSLLLAAYAGEDLKPIPHSDTKVSSNTESKKLPTDTVPSPIITDELISFHDSLDLFPSNEIYNEWDTENIHYTKFDIASLKDSTIKIILCNNSSSVYVHPFNGKVTCPYGQCRRYFHYGVDIDLNTGDAVNAAFDGKVRIAKKNPSYGNVVVIRHPNGLETYYAHLSKLKVKEGEEVKAGQIVGLGGNTGYSRGSHLHFEVRYLGQPLNPSQLISFADEKLISDTLLITKKSFDKKYAHLQNIYSKEYQKQKPNVAKTIETLRTGNVYVIKDGDTLFSIARRNGTTVALICEKNKINANSILRIGQKVKL